ncbi:hypothetical protein ACKS23_07763 [Histoplasma ohiense]
MAGFRKVGFSMPGRHHSDRFDPPPKKKKKKIPNSLWSDLPGYSIYIVLPHACVSRTCKHRLLLWRARDFVSDPGILCLVMRNLIPKTPAKSAGNGT